ncbi:MAG: ribbon-helix-helix protein, CopG family [Candidatus Methanoperedens sp.]|nr:ribbon-helix-helix protein, CopG family [Candidatus Methanoperedens sp.]
MSEIKYIQSELNINIYHELKKTAEKEGISIKEAIREAVLEWVREKSGFDKEDPFFKMHTFRASKDLSENHDEIYEGKK